MKNTIETFKEKNIVAGSFPCITDSLKVVTKVEEGDLVGVSTTGTFGKYDTVTYKTAYGIAYEGTDANTECAVILSGEIAKSFIKFPESKEEELKIELRRISIFIK